VLFRPFEQGARKPAELEYLLFGDVKEAFLAHLITAPPDFDQMVSVQALDGRLSAEDLARGVTVRMASA
jgi:hypothetical protein